MIDSNGFRCWIRARWSKRSKISTGLLDSTTTCFIASFAKYDFVAWFFNQQAGERNPYFPKPMLIDIKLTMPVLNSDTPVGNLEEQCVLEYFIYPRFMRQTVMYRYHREDAVANEEDEERQKEMVTRQGTIDRSILQLISVHPHSFRMFMGSKRANRNDRCEHWICAPCSISRNHSSWRFHLRISNICRNSLNASI
jgi:hypothetical protein